MPSREQVNALLARGLDYQKAGEELGIPAGQAYLIATGQPADTTVTQHPAGPSHENPTRNKTVLDWIKRRAAAQGSQG